MKNPSPPLCTVPGVGDPSASLPTFFDGRGVVPSLTVTERLTSANTHTIGDLKAKINTKYYCNLMICACNICYTLVCAYWLILTLVLLNRILKENTSLHHSPTHSLIHSFIHSFARLYSPDEESPKVTSMPRALTALPVILVTRDLMSPRSSSNTSYNEEPAGGFPLAVFFLCPNKLLRIR